MGHVSGDTREAIVNLAKPTEILWCISHYVILHDPYIVLRSQIHRYQKRTVSQDIYKIVQFPQRCDKNDKLKSFDFKILKIRNSKLVQ